MMNESGKSDKSVVPKKSANKAGHDSTAAEQMEGRDLTKGNSPEQNVDRTQSREDTYNALEAIRKAAKADKKMRFTALLHHVYNIDALKNAFYDLKRNAAAGVDGETWQQYEENLGENLQDLSERLKRGGYRAKPVKRVYIPKPNGQKRPLGIPALQDKIVQRALVDVLNAIYENDFLGFSYGFRPGRKAHDALDALYVAFMKRKVNWVLDADIRDFFGAIDHEWLVKFIEHRIADKRVVRLIQKWLNAGVLEDGDLTECDSGTPQGGIISPLLANIYLHYVFDLWTQQWRTRCAKSDVFVVRYADDFIVGFHFLEDAEQYLEELKKRFAKFNLELHPDKTRLIEFGRFVIPARRRRGLGKPETFNFLGFRHICGTRKDGVFTVLRQTIKKRMHAKLKEVKIELRRRMHMPIKDVGRWLRSVVNGHYNYFGVPTNNKQLNYFRTRVIHLWHHVLIRRSQRTRITWERMYRLADMWLPSARVKHQYPLDRFPRQYLR
jgi:RNA-directed DNA polymerase